jgi:hypothetical protein
VTGVALGALSEGTSAGTRRTNLYAEFRNEERIARNVANPRQQAQVQNTLEVINDFLSEEIPNFERGRKVTITSSDGMTIFAQKVNGKLYYQDSRPEGVSYVANTKDVPNDIRNPYSGTRPKKAPVFKSKKSEEKEE